MIDGQFFVLGICGGSCSGKTTLAKKIRSALGVDHVSILFQDSYYIDQSAKFNGDGGNVNFDHPDSLDFALMAKHLQLLKQGLAVDVPLYDFVTHKRVPKTENFPAKPLVIVDGTLILSQEMIRRELHSSVFIDCSEDLRLERRKRRDTQERGRSVEGVLRQFNNHVKPMHDTFVEPSREFGNRILSGEGKITAAATELVQFLQSSVMAVALP